MGKQLVIVGADFSAVAIGTAKVLVSISAMISGTQYTNSAPTGITVTATWDDQSTSTVSGWTTNPVVWGSTVGQQTMTISYTRGGVTRTTTVTADVQQGSGPTPTTYTITTTVQHGSSSGATSITAGGTATVTIFYDTGYSYPNSISVTGASYNWDAYEGVISLSNPTANVVIEVTCTSGTFVPVHKNNLWLSGCVSADDGVTVLAGDPTSSNTVQRHAVVAIPDNTATVTMFFFKTGGAWGQAFYNSNFVYISGLKETSSSGVMTKNVPSGAKYMHLSCAKNEANPYTAIWKDSSNNIISTIDFSSSSEIQVENPSGGAYSDWTPLVMGYVSSTTGAVTSNNSYNAVSYNIPSGASTLRYQTFPDSSNRGIAFFNGNTYISGQSTTTGSKGDWTTISIPANATIVKQTYPMERTTTTSGTGYTYRGVWFE